MKSGLKFNGSIKPARHWIITQSFVIVVSLSLALCATLLGAWVAERISLGVLERDSEGVARFMSVLFEPLVQDLDHSAEITQADLAKMRQLAADETFLRDLTEVKIWRPDGRILFAEDEGLIGQRPGSAELTEVLSTKETFSYFASHQSDSTESASDYDHELHEVFVPLVSHKTGKILAVGEFSTSSARLHEKVFSVLGESAFPMVGVGLLAALSISLIVVQGSRTIAQQKGTLAQLGSRKGRARREGGRGLDQLEDLDKEAQRRIGIELHDGPAQLLTYVLMQIDEMAPR